MRRTLSLSLENFHRVSEPTLSLEEEQIVMTDAVELASDINQEFNEANRIVEISDALEDLAVIADQIEAASPTEIALMETAGDMAVAGTDIESEEIVPSLESYRGKRIAAEGFKQTAGQIWKNIQEFLKKIWEKITQFFSNIFLAIPNARHRLNQLTDKLKEIDGLTARGTVFEIDTKTGGMGSLVSKLSVDGKVPSNDAEFLSELTKVHDFTKFVYGDNITNRNALGISIADAIEGFNPEVDLDSQAQLIIDACEKYNSTQSYPGKQGPKTKSGSHWLSRSETLIGNITLIHKSFDEADRKTTLGNMDRLRNSGIYFDSIADQLKLKDGKVTLPIPTQATLNKMITEMLGVLDLLEKYKTSPESKAVEATRKRLESASKKASEKNAEDIDANGESARTTYLKAMLNFNIAYKQWVSNPSVEFAKYLMSEVNAIISYIKMCIKLYEQNKK